MCLQQCLKQHLHCATKWHSLFDQQTFINLLLDANKMLNQQFFMDIQSKVFYRFEIKNITMRSLPNCGDHNSLVTVRKYHVTW